MSHSQFHSTRSLILRHAWLNLWDKHMTTGRINQVATSSFFMSQPFYRKQHEGSQVCVDILNCVLASVSQLSCTTALRRRQRRKSSVEERRRQKHRLSCTSGTRFFISARNTAELRYLVRVTSNGRLKQPLIRTTPEEYRSSRARTSSTQC